MSAKGGLVLVLSLMVLGVALATQHRMLDRAEGGSLAPPVESSSSQTAANSTQQAPSVRPEPQSNQTKVEQHANATQTSAPTTQQQPQQHPTAAVPPATTTTTAADAVASAAPHLAAIDKNGTQYLPVGSVPVIMDHVEVASKVNATIKSLYDTQIGRASCRERV